MTLEIYKFLFVSCLTISVIGFIILRNKAASWERMYKSLVRVDEMYNEKVKATLNDLITQVEDRNKRLKNLNHEVLRLTRANEDLRVAIAKHQEIEADK
ncbi:hypothetical protein phiL_116 [Escherichia phage LAMP]|uniref:Uncharacterized protein n=1 Tax=Escherichia phage LAMP TaxID=2065191 RepID=A0A2I6PD79_9CAUD|nr:hypothetical protein phiL_116 [Escherichia phage LAMP]